MTTTKAILLASTVLTGIAVAQPAPAVAEQLIVAQAPPQQDSQENPDRPRRPGESPRRGQQQQKQQTPPDQSQRPGAQERQEQRPAAQGEQPQRPPAQERQPPERPAAQERAPQSPTAQERRGPPERPAAQEGQPPSQPPAARGRPGQPQPPTAQERREQTQPPAAQGTPGQPQPPTAQERREPPTPPAAQGRPGPTAPSTAQERPGQQPPAAGTQPTQPQPPAAQGRPSQPPPPAAQERTTTPPPAAGTQPTQPQPPAAQRQPGQPGAQQPATAGTRTTPGAVEPPREQVRDARDFLKKDTQQQTHGIDQLRQERREVREGNRVFIQEADRTIIREGNQTIIRHNEADRFTVGAHDVRVERRGNETFSIVERSGGVRIITVLDTEGRLIRRIRRDPSGREIIIIDNGGPRRDTYIQYVELPPPVIRIPRERYIVELERANEGDIYAALTAPPVERIDRRYTLDQVRYNVQLRDRMPRVDVDTVNFETGSWQLTPDQVDRLAPVADAMRRAIERNPREVLLIEGHTDAVGSDVDNLSLSDRRAETVAIALTEQFGVPAENLTTQGYGEQYLKIPTQGPERQNRRVAVRRITPLLDQQAADTSGARPR